MLYLRCRLDAGHCDSRHRRCIGGLVGAASKTLRATTIGAFRCAFSRFGSSSASSMSAAIIFGALAAMIGVLHGVSLFAG